VNSDREPRLPRTVEAYSFDLFDTLLGRHFACPKDLVLEVEQRLRASGLGLKSFAHHRVLAESNLRQNGEFRREVTLAQIYAELGNAEHRDESWQNAAIRVELEVERESIFPIPAGLALLRRARSRKKRILFTSDTTFPRDFLEPLLREFGISRPDDRLYLSVESGLMKSTGELFHHVASSEGINPSRLFHIGDNQESDVRMARAAGWKATIFRPTESNRYEIPSAEPESDPARLAQSLFHGLRRKLRLLDSAEAKTDRVIFDTTIDVAGPLIIAYSAWCLRQAVERGINRLYFLSRDGEILYQIAERLNQKLRYPVELRYLFVSRQSLLLPALHDPLEEELAWILAPTAVLTVRIAFKRVELAPETVADELTRAGFPAEIWDDNLTEERRKALGECLMTSALRERLIQQGEQKRKDAVAYLEQNKLTSDSSFALVDIGWRGTLQKCISRLLESTGRTDPVTGFYFGLLGTRRHKPDDELVPFFFDASETSMVDPHTYLVGVLELFVAARHGGVSGFHMVDGKVEPAFRTVQNENGLAWGLATQQRAMLELTEALCAQPGLNLAVDAINKDTVLNLERFTRCPSHEEAQVYGAHLDAEDQNESVFAPLARPFSFGELRRHRDKGFLHHHNEWSAGAVALTSPIYRRWLGVENTLVRQHPICGPGVIPLAGFGPVEGPNQEFQLPRFVWAYGPGCSLELDLPETGRHLLAMEIKNYQGNQGLEFIFGDEVIADIEVPPNLGEIGSEVFQAEIRLPERNGCLCLKIRPRHWSSDERPLAVIFTRIELRASKPVRPLR